MDHIIYSGTGLLLFFTVIAGIILSSSRAYSEGTAYGNAVSTASVFVPATCSMTATVNTAHNATVANGTYQTDIGRTTIKTLCNDPNGYAIYAIGYTGGDTGVAAGTNTVLHGTSISGNHDIATGTAESGNTSNWAMKIGAVSASIGDKSLTPSVTDYSTYHSVPSTYDKVASFASSTDDTVGSSVTTTYAAFVAGDQPTGTYTGQVKYVLLHPSGSDSPAVTTMQNVNYWGASVSVGQEVTATDNRDGQTYTVARLCTNWEGNNCTQSQLWMTQNLDYTIASTEQNPITSLNTDLTQYQDNLGNTYAGYSVNDKGVITWQPNSTLDTPATISDFSYQTAAGSSVSGWTNSPTVPYQADGTLNSEDVYIVTSGNTNRDTIYGTLGACKAAQSGTDAEKTAICQHYKVGNYYNWSAAVAMNDTTNFSTQYTDMSNSICPAGWRLPKGLQGDTPNPAETADADATPATTISEFNKLFLANGITGTSALNGGTTSGGQWIAYTGTGSSNIRSTSTYRDTNLPLYFARSGNVNGTTLYGSSNSGYYWSSSAVSGARAYDLDFYSGGLDPAHRDSRSLGVSVRCVAREETTINDVETMQEFASMSDKKKAKVVASMETEKQYKLKDSRDGNEYWVAKQKDGKVWMTQNLDLCIGCTGTDALTSNNTDLNVSGSGAYASDYTESNGVITWAPSNTYTTVTGTPATVDFSNKTVSGWSSQNYQPYQAEAGTNILYGTDTTALADMDACTAADHTQSQCEHYKIGNYYNWSAAIASSNSQPISNQYTVAQNSICPAGWRLPNGLTYPDNTVVESEFNTLLKAAEITTGTDLSGNVQLNYTNGGFGKITNPQYAFSRYGNVGDPALDYFGASGVWWSSAASSATDSYNLRMGSGNVWPARSTHRQYGFNLRCLLR